MPGRRAGADHGQLILVVEPADHVAVEHHDGLGQREERMLDVVLRAEQPALLARERHEDDPARRRVAAGAQPPGQLQHHRRPRRVVIGAVVDVVREESQRARHQSAVAQVVVVAADDDGLVGVRPGALQNADDVLGLELLASRWRSARPSVQPLRSRERGFRSESICSSRAASAGWPASASSLSANSRVSITNGMLAKSARTRRPKPQATRLSRPCRSPRR